MELRFHKHRPGLEGIVAALQNEGFSEWIERLGIYYGYEKIRGEQVGIWPDLNHLFLAISEREPVGFAHMCTYFDGAVRIGSFHAIGCCEYDQSKLAVIPRYRGRGIGSAMLQHCIAFFDQHDVDEMRVYVYSDNIIAKKLLEHQGLHHSGVDLILAEVDLTKDIPLKDIDTSANIRIAKERDAAKLLKFSREADLGMRRASKVGEARAYILRDDLEVVVIAELEGRIVGCFEAEKHTGHLGPIVHPDFRRKGIGSALMYNVLRVLQQRGYRKALTDSEADRIPAHALYKKFCFQEMRRRECWAKPLK